MEVNGHFQFQRNAGISLESTYYQLDNTVMNIHNGTLHPNITINSPVLTPYYMQCLQLWIIFLFG